MANECPRSSSPRSLSPRSFSPPGEGRGRPWGGRAGPLSRPGSFASFCELAPEDASLPAGHGGDQLVAARARLVNHPGHYMNHEASHLTDARSVEYWASLPGHVHNQAFVFELEQPQVLSRVEWKDRGDYMSVARLSLEAQVGEAWQKLSTWDASRKSEWQGHNMSMSLRSQHWRLTFASNHGDENHIVVQAVRFMVKLPPPSPAQNAMHSQLITHNLWSRRRYTDVEVVCGERSFPAHRAVLAAASPVFEAMLDSEMRESESQSIRITDAEERAVQDTLEYIYTGAVSKDAGCGMVVLGHKYGIDGLVEFASPMALGNLTPENVVAEVRALRAYVDDGQLGLVFEALKDRVHENRALFQAVLLDI